MRSGVALAIALLVSGGCATTPLTTPVGTLVVTTAPAIRGVGVEPKTIDVQQGQAATIRYHLMTPAQVSLELVDEEGRVICRLEADRQPAGMQEMRWDGRTSEGELVPSGVYRYIIHATMDDGLSTMDAPYDPSGNTGGEELQPMKFEHDPETGTLRWVMPQAGYARLRVGLEGFPHLRTLLDWEPLEAGAQSLTWDGRDASGLIMVNAHPHLSIKLAAFTMPDNTLIVNNQQSANMARSSTENSPDRQSKIQNPKSEMSTHSPLARPDASYLHARHSRQVCHEVQVRVEFPQPVRYDEQHRPLLVGPVPVRVRLAAREAAHLINQRFEVVIFEDTTLLFEEEEGTQPFSFIWDTTHFTPGAHLLTVNVLSYDDHYGVITQPVMIGARREAGS